MKCAHRAKNRILLFIYKKLLYTRANLFVLICSIVVLAYTTQYDDIKSVQCAHSYNFVGTHTRAKLLTTLYCKKL